MHYILQWSVASTIWLTSLLWGDIYVQALPVFSGTSVKLFGVRQAAPSRREQVSMNSYLAIASPDLVPFRPYRMYQIA